MFLFPLTVVLSLIVILMKYFARLASQWSVRAKLCQKELLRQSRLKMICIMSNVVVVVVALS